MSIPIIALQAARKLDYGIWREHSPQERIVNAAVHVDETEAVEHLVAGEAARHQAVGTIVVGGVSTSPGCPRPESIGRL